MRANKRNRDKAISILLLIAMMISMIPMTALADSPGGISPKKTGVYRLK